MAECEELVPEGRPCENGCQMDNDLVEMQADIMSKGNQLSHNWSELFGLLSKYQAELVIKHDQLVSQETKMKHFDCEGSGYTGDNSEENETSLSLIQRELKMKTDLLVASQAEVLSIEKNLMTTEGKVVELQQQLKVAHDGLNKKKHELAIKDGLLKKMEKQMVKELDDLQMETSKLTEELRSEKQAHQNTFEQLQEAVKSFQGSAIKPTLGQSSIQSSQHNQQGIENSTGTTFCLSTAVPAVVVNGGCHLNIPTCNLIYSENYDPKTVTLEPSGEDVGELGNDVSADITPSSTDEQPITPESHEIAQPEGNGTHKSKQWKRTRKRKHPQKVTNIFDTTPTQEGAKDVITVPLPKKNTQVAKHQTPVVTLTVPKIKPKQEMKVAKLKISNSIFKKADGKEKEDGTDCSMFKEVTDNLVKEPDLMPLSFDMKPVIGGRKVKRPFQLFTCLVCANEFVSLNELSSHAVEHTGSVVGFDLFQCEMCGKKFTDKSNYRRHRRIHSGEKPYKCQFCDVAYSRSDILKQHLVTRHSNLQPS